jgi:hypothetical protein
MICQAIWPGAGKLQTTKLPEEVSFEIPVLPDLEALAASDFQEDTSTANHSSIAFLAEYDGKRAIFAADAPAGGLLASLERLLPEKPFDLDVLKVSHHGSSHTTSLNLIKIKLPALRDLDQRIDIQTPGPGGYRPPGYWQRRGS